jgi:hypothetical protein
MDGMRTEVDHLTTAEKTTAIIVLAEALQSMTLVGNPMILVVFLFHGGSR